MDFKVSLYERPYIGLFLDLFDGGSGFLIVLRERCIEMANMVNKQRKSKPRTPGVRRGWWLAGLFVFVCACSSDDSADEVNADTGAPDASIGIDGESDEEAVYDPNRGFEEVAWAFKGDGQFLSQLARAADGTLYVGTDDGKLYAIDSETGKARWSYATGGRIGAAPTVLADGKIAVGSWDKKLHVVNADGSLAWTYEVEGLLDQSVSVDGQGRLYLVSDDGVLHVLSDAGELVWQLDLGAAPTTATSIFDDGQRQTLFVSTSDEHVHCIDGENSAELAKISGYGRFDIALSAQGHAYLGTSTGHIVAIDRDCTVLYDVAHTYAVMMPIALDASGDLYAAGHHRQMYRFKKADGTVVWQTSTRRYQSLNGAPSLGADGQMYAGSDSLFAFSADGKIEEVSTIDMIGAPILSEDGAVFGTTEHGYLVRLDVKGPKPGSSDWSTQHGNYARTGYLRKP